MSKVESKSGSPLGEYPAYGEAPGGRPKTNSWDQTIAPTLAFVIPYTLVSWLMERWLPWFRAIGIGAFVGGLASFGFRGPRERRYGFGKYVAFYLHVSVGFCLLAFAVDSLWAALLRK